MLKYSTSHLYKSTPQINPTNPDPVQERVTGNATLFSRPSKNRLDTSEAPPPPSQGGKGVREEEDRKKCHSQTKGNVNKLQFKLKFNCNTLVELEILRTDDTKEEVGN